MRRGGRSAQRRHGVLDAVLSQRDDVHVTFDDEDFPRGANGRSCLEQPIQLATLGEHRRFRRIEVFGLPVVEDPAAEADDAAAGIVNREDDAMPKTVVALSASLAMTRPALSRLFSG